MTKKSNVWSPVFTKIEEEFKEEWKGVELRFKEALSQRALGASDRQESDVCRSFLRRYFRVLTKYFQALPLYASQSAIVTDLKAADRSTMLIVGATGCGKTLLLPQIIYEHYSNNYLWDECRRVFVVLRSVVDKRVMALRFAHQTRQHDGVCQDRRRCQLLLRAQPDP